MSDVIYYSSMLNEYLDLSRSTGFSPDQCKISWLVFDPVIYEWDIS